MLKKKNIVKSFLGDSGSMRKFVFSILVLEISIIKNYVNVIFLSLVIISLKDFSRVVITFFSKYHEHYLIKIIFIQFYRKNLRQEFLKQKVLRTLSIQVFIREI